MVPKNKLSSFRFGVKFLKSSSCSNTSLRITFVFVCLVNGRETVVSDKG